MQAEEIRTGDRYDVLDDRGRVTGGWTATGDAVVEDGYVYASVRFHDGQEGTNSWPVGQQVPLSFGAGPKPPFPEGTPEYDTYRAALTEELAKFAAGEEPYPHQYCADCGCNTALPCVCSKDCAKH
jgi:hypothetical protein